MNIMDEISFIKKLCLMFTSIKLHNQKLIVCFIPNGHGNADTWHDHMYECYTLVVE